MTTSTGLVVGILGPASPASHRVVGILTAVHGFRSYDLCEPAKAALESLDPLLCGDRSLRDMVTSVGWEALLGHRLLGPEANRLLHAMRSALPGTVLPASVWVSHVQAAVLAAASMLGPAPVVIHDVRTNSEESWLREQGGQMWRLEGRPATGVTCVMDTGVSDVALGRRIARELASLQRDTGRTSAQEET